MFTAEFDWRGKYRIAALAALLLAGAASGIIFLFLQMPREHPLRRAIALQLRHARVSFAHTSDVLFAPYLFVPSQLPNYSFNISFSDIGKLDEALGDWDPDVQKPLPGDRKIFANARFEADSYAGDVKVRYRGDSPLHWAYLKKSWLVEFPSKNLFKGMRRLHLVVPESEDFYTGLINSYRAKKLGLAHQEPTLVRLAIDGYDQGVYLALEDSSQEWLEKQGMLGNVLTFDSDLADHSRSVFSDENIQYWSPTTLPELYTPATMLALQQLLTRADDATFRTLAPVIFDLDAIYKWDVLAVLAQAHGQDDLAPSNNMKLFFDRATGKFSVLPIHLGIREDLEQLPEEFHKNVPLIAARILGIPEFRAKRNALLKRYLETEAAEDVEYFDDVTNKYRGEFLSDFSKKATNLEYLSRVRQVRRIMVENIERAKSELNYEYPSFAGGVSAAKLALNEGFASLPRAGDSGEAFTLRYPQFIYERPLTIRLPAGAYSFSENVIIPPRFRVVIDPGATIYFSSGVSIVSYSPIIAAGTEYSPIILTVLDPEKSWGSIVVIGTGSVKSSWKYVRVSYGSEMKGVNGIYATGMVAFHGSDAVIEQSEFSYSRGEDALNPKYAEVAIRNNFFTDSLSDALDCDVCRGAIESNTFRAIGTGKNLHKGAGNTGGDAIDISFTEALISRNTIIGATDKGISIGERSRPKVEFNIVAKNSIGIAVKDLSHAELRSNVILGNDAGIELYQKKEIFGPATATLSETVLWANRKDIVETLDGSEIKDGGSNVIQSRGDPKPDFQKLIPASVLALLVDVL